MHLSTEAAASRGGDMQDCALMYALMANTGKRPGEAPPPPVMLPAALRSGGSDDQPLAGKTAGVFWQVRPAFFQWRPAITLPLQRSAKAVGIKL
jgi:hypothetical protein